jgi:hypothetical protein
MNRDNKEPEWIDDKFSHVYFVGLSWVLNSFTNKKEIREFACLVR